MHAVAFTIKRALLRTTDISRRCVRRFGITPARYDMLYAIAHERVRLQSDLWRLFDVSRSTVSRMFAALEELGLARGVRKAGTPSRLVYLTDKGRRLLDDAYAGCHRPLCLVFESLFSKTRRRLDRALQVVHVNDAIAGIAKGFGDRSRFTYPFSHPIDLCEPVDEPWP